MVWNEQKQKMWRRDGNNTQNYTKKILMTQIAMMVWSFTYSKTYGMWSQVALGIITMNKASGGDGIPVGLFQILNDDIVKVLHSVCQQIWKTQQWPQDRKRSVFIPIPKKGNAKECSNSCKIALISHASKVILKILQARLQWYMNWDLPDVQAGFRKGRGARGQIANICWIIEKARQFQKNIYFCFIDYAKAFDSVDHNKLWAIPGSRSPSERNGNPLQ